MYKRQHLVYVNSIGKKALNDVSLKLRKGEILSVAGVEGNGQAELAAILTGMKKPVSGCVKVQGENIEKFEPAVLRRHHLTYIPEDRMTNGCASVSYTHLDVYKRQGVHDREPSRPGQAAQSEDRQAVPV